MDNVELAAKSRRAYMVAPAGCGKTHLIAEAVTKHAVRRELILTHTHAGVDVLRRRLRFLKASNSSFEIETIAGLALRYTTAFPHSSGQISRQPSNDDEWKQTYAGCSRLLKKEPFREIIRASYSGIYVDEYQDCSVDQHELVCALAQILPCRIFGDPLQGIFDFKNTVLVNWDRDIKTSFEMLPELSFPWRWEKTSPALGQWLFQVRSDLLNKRVIDLNNAPRSAVTWIQLPPDQNQHYATRLATLKSATNKTGNLVAILRWEAECNELVNKLSGMYHNMETVACDALMKAAEDIESKTGMARMEAVVRFANECLTAITASLRTVVAALKTGKQKAGSYVRQAEMNLLATVIENTSLKPVLPALEGLRQIPDTRLWRRELFLEMLRALRAYNTGAHPDLKTAAWSTRNRTRHSERKLGTRLISRTVLVKGLQFDHCIILDADSLRAKDLYVALTRGAKTLTIVSRSTSLVPEY